MEILAILSLAVALDLALGDPPNALHPVAWMGRVVSLLARGGDKRRPAFQFLYGLAMVLVAVGVFAVPVYFLLFYLKGFNFAAYLIIAGVLLKLSFSIRGLKQAAVKVKRLLVAKELAKARFELRSLVSRDTAQLPEPLLVSAAVESVAEGACDSLVAPLFYFLLLGVPGAIAYRVVNTMDAMIGYHGKYEYLGKAASRLDDILNFIPARITALSLVLAAFLARRNGRRSWQTALGEHSRTESPNAGWPMAAIAGALDVQLEKAGHYKLGDGKALLTPETIDSSIRLFYLAASAWLLICFTVGVIHLVITA